VDRQILTQMNILACLLPLGVSDPSRILQVGQLWKRFGNPRPANYITRRKG